MRHFSKFLLLPMLLLCACSSEDSEVDEVLQQQDSSTVDNVMFRLTRADGVSTFADEGISEVTVYVYHQLRTGTELLESKTVAVDGSTLQYSLPLGESYHTFVVAGAATVADEATLEDVKLRLDPTAGGDVWLSPVVKFSSDKTVSGITLNMRRMNARVTFSPVESQEELSALAAFDKLRLTFGNVAATWLVKEGKAVQEDVVITTDEQQGYKAAVTTFATEDKGGLYIEYLKGETLVNTSSSVLDVGTRYEASHSYNLQVPVTNSDYVSTPFGNE